MRSDLEITNFRTAPPGKSTQVREEAEALVALLQEHPQQWGEVYTDLKPNTAANRASTLRGFDHISAVTRGGSVWAMWDGPQGEATNDSPAE